MVGKGGLWRRPGGVKDIAAEWGGLPCTLIKMPVAAFAEKKEDYLFRKPDIY